MNESLQFNDSRDIPDLIISLMEQDEPEFEPEENPDPERLRELIEAAESGNFDHVISDQTPFIQRAWAPLENCE